MTKKQTIKEQALEAGLNPRIVYQRVSRMGWTLEKALNTPVRKRQAKKPTKVTLEDVITEQRDAAADVAARLEKAQAELAIGAKRCKLIALACSVLIALAAAVIISG